jgi:hypothetical protein
MSMDSKWCVCTLGVWNIPMRRKHQAIPAMFGRPCWWQCLCCTFQINRIIAYVTFNVWNPSETNFFFDSPMSEYQSVSHSFLFYLLSLLFLRQDHTMYLRLALNLWSSLLAVQVCTTTPSFISFNDQIILYSLGRTHFIDSSVWDTYLVWRAAYPELPLMENQAGGEIWSFSPKKR